MPSWTSAVGTGTLACLLAGRGTQVIAADPAAAASLAVARRKPGANHVRWLHADAASLPPLQVDLVTMTGNVAQVFLTGREWAATLHRAARQALRREGRLVFESRDPARAAWREWNRDQTYRRVEHPGRLVETWTDLTKVAGNLVSFRTTFAFGRDGAVLDLRLHAAVPRPR